MSNIILKTKRRQYFNDEHSGTDCPECGGILVSEENTILLSVKTKRGQEQFMTNVPEGTFCNKCAVVVFNKESLENAARFAVGNKKNAQYTVVGIIDLEATEKQKRQLKTGANFSLPRENARKETVVAKKKIGRNEPCLCGSEKKYKRCCAE